MLPRDVLAAARDRRGEAERLLESLVNEPSGSHDRDGVSRVIGALGAVLDALGFSIELVRDEGRPRHLLARLAGGRAGPDARPVLVIGHADTVFPRGDGRRFSLSADGARIHGPGCADMKGGLVVAIEALRAVLPAVRASAGAVEVLINGDEELGSPHSRELIRERARRARAALVYENCEERAGLIVGRKGLGRARIEIRGRAAHAGINPEEGVSAVVEMAREVLRIERLRAAERGLSVITGIARGGISRNTVPPAAELEVDIRYRAKEDGERALAGLREIVASPETAGASAALVLGELHRPPMPPGTGRALFERAAALSRDLLLPSPIAGALESGGGSDGNLTADLGVPTLDGLGVVGGAIHTVHEYCERASIPERAALSALLIPELLEA